MPERPTLPNSTRRGFLKGAASVAAAGLALSGTAATSLGQSYGRGSRHTARNLVFMVADGMSQGCWTMADMASLKLKNRRSAWASLYANGAPMAQVMTHSANSLVTDSAAGGSAWGIGLHVDNGEICQHGDKQYEPILVTAKKQGLATGLVTTTRLTHATPASFIANVPNRGLEDEIAAQILNREVDVMLGGGARHFSDELLAKHADLTTVRDTKSLRGKAKNNGRLLGLFNNSHLSYDKDRPETEPHIKEMSIAALENLAARDQGFVLQIEGGRVDHGGHATDAVANLFDMIAFDDAVDAVTSWARRRSDTLVIVTTDHGTAGPELTLYGDEGNNAFDLLLKAKRTLTSVSMEAGRGEDRIDRLVRGCRESLGAELTAEQIDYLERVMIRGEPGDAFKGHSQESAILSAVLANHWGVSFVSSNHTAEYVHATAVGPGSDKLRPLMDNIDFYRIMVETLGLRI